jgi:hypothetical protein
MTRLDSLNREFDALVACIQTPKVRRGMKDEYGISASAKKLGKAAVTSARTRG